MNPPCDGGAAPEPDCQVGVHPDSRSAFVNRLNPLQECDFPVAALLVPFPAVGSSDLFLSETDFYFSYRSRWRESSALRRCRRNWHIRKKSAPADPNCSKVRPTGVPTKWRSRRGSIGIRRPLGHKPSVASCCARMRNRAKARRGSFQTTRPAAARQECLVRAEQAGSPRPATKSDDPKPPVGTMSSVLGMLECCCPVFICTRTQHLAETTVRSNWRCPGSVASGRRRRRRSCPGYSLAQSPCWR